MPQTPKKKHTMTPEGSQRIKDAQKKRWDAYHARQSEKRQEKVGQ